MSRLGKLAFWAVVAGQVVLLLAFIGVRENSLRTGTEVVLQTVPVDPRSLLQGDFAILRYQIGQLPAHLRNAPVGRNVWVTLRKGAEVWEAESYSLFQPDQGDAVFIKGRVESGARLEFGIGTFFVPEGSGRIVEQSRDVKVVAVLDGDGDAVIKDLLIDGRPFDPSLVPLTVEPARPPAAPATVEAEAPPPPVKRPP